MFVVREHDNESVELERLLLRAGLAVVAVSSIDGGRVEPGDIVVLVASVWSVKQTRLCARASYGNVPIIVVPTTDDAVDRQMAFESGATDVIPASATQWDELLGKVLRLTAPPQPVVRIGGSTFDPIRHYLYKGTTCTYIPPVQSVILYTLVRETRGGKRMKTFELLIACRLPHLTSGSLRKQVSDLKQTLEQVFGRNMLDGNLRSGIRVCEEPIRVLSRRAASEVPLDTRASVEVSVTYR